MGLGLDDEDSRKCTDIIYGIIQFIYIAIVLGVVIYFSFNCDMKRLTNGYDDCGNVCGENNSRIENISCTGKDMTHNKYFQIRYIQKNMKYNKTHNIIKTYEKKLCVAKCDQNYKPILNICTREKNFTDSTLVWELNAMLRDLKVYWIGILFCCLFGIIYSFFAAVLFRCQPICCMVLDVQIIMCSTVILIFLVARQSYILFAIVLLITLPSCTMPFFLSWQIHYGFLFLKEAAKAIYKMPAMVCEITKITFLAMIVNFSISIAFLLIISTSGELTEISPGRYAYGVGVVNWIGYILVIFLCFWMYHFILGCQRMIVAGAVGAWYFDQNKVLLRRPLFKSFKKTLRYHLGTISIGSLLINLISLMKCVADTLRDLRENIDDEYSAASRAIIRLLGTILTCGLNFLEDFLKFIANNSYVITILYGFPFCESTKTVWYMYKNSLINVLVIKAGTFIIFIGAKIFFFGLNFLFVLVIFRNALTIAPHLIVILLNYTIFSIYMTVYDMVIETMFVCFVIDFENGAQYMSKEFLECVEKASKDLD